MSLPYVRARWSFSTTTHTVNIPWVTVEKSPEAIKRDRAERERKIALSLSHDARQIEQARIENEKNISMANIERMMELKNRRKF